MKKLLFVATLSALTSCASHYGYINDSASISQSNFSYTKHDIRGEAKATYILGFGGLKRQAIADEAKRDMLAKNPLGPNQTIANVTVNYKTLYFPFYNQTICTVTADVVEFK